MNTAENKHSNKTTARIVVTVDSDLRQHIQYWAEKNDVSINELFRIAIRQYIARQNKDYDLPALEIQRLNQLIDHIAELSSNISSLERVTTSGFESLISLTRGDNYLLDNDDGELYDGE